MYLANVKIIRIFLIVIGLIITNVVSAQDVAQNADPNRHFLVLATSNNESLIDSSLDFVKRNWTEGFEVMLIESLYFSLNKDMAGKYLSLLEQKTGQKFGYDMNGWYKWLWNNPPSYGPEYFEFKAALHTFIDPRFGTYFSQRQDRSTIRLDEVVWGGVKQDGIPPLRNPKMISAVEANYLDDSNIVFGIEVNGDVRAYPKRILAWHEMFTDTVGGIAVAGVYCTLCGTVILYETIHEGTNYHIGTSGFLYRSNKLMYDQATQSLWSTLEGKPVIGPLVGKGIRLEYRSVVTTTWGAWKARHPNTTVLSLDTGHRRDYGEGVAYSEYFNTDDLMFNVPETDRRLNNKDEILAIRFPEISSKSLAISSKFLMEHPIYSAKLHGVQFTVFTDQSGAHRVYDTMGIHFNEYDGIVHAVDHRGERWTLHENKIVSASGKDLRRIASYNAFWFGYKAAFPDVQLIH